MWSWGSHSGTKSPRNAYSYLVADLWRKRKKNLGVLFPPERLILKRHGLWQYLCYRLASSPSHHKLIRVQLHRKKKKKGKESISLQRQVPLSSPLPTQCLKTTQRTGDAPWRLTVLNELSGTFHNRVFKTPDPPRDKGLLSKIRRLHPSVITHYTEHTQSTSCSNYLQVLGGEISPLSN